MTQAVINGITLGMGYAMLAVGFALIYGVMGVLNFAHGEFVTLGAYVTLAVGTLGDGVGWYLASLVVAVLVGLLAGATIDQTVFRPLRKRGTFPVLVSTFGLSVIIISAIILTAGSEPWSLRNSLTTSVYSIPGAGATISAQGILIDVVGVASLAALYHVVRRTDAGRQVRAVAEDVDTALLTGINPERVMMGVTAVSLALASLGGALVAPLFVLTPTFGFEMLLQVFAIVVIGGLGNFGGAAVGGILFGIISSLATLYLAPQWVSTYTFGLLIVVLIIRPEGLFGRRSGRSRAIGRFKRRRAVRA